FFGQRPEYRDKVCFVRGSAPGMAPGRWKALASAKICFMKQLSGVQPKQTGKIVHRFRDFSRYRCTSQVTVAAIVQDVADGELIVAYQCDDKNGTGQPFALLLFIG